LLKGIITEADWDLFKSDVIIDFLKDNNFTELREAELTRERVGTLDSIQNYVGQYYSKEWVMKNVLYLTQEDIDTMKEQIEQESGTEPDSEDEL
jgi:hypothetical protein